MIYRVEYGLYDLRCGGRQYIHEPNQDSADRRARQIAQHNFNCKVSEGRIRFPKQRDIYDKFMKDFKSNVNDSWWGGDTKLWARAEEWYWSMIEDHIWYKAEEALEPPQLMPVEEWEEF